MSNNTIACTVNYALAVRRSFEGKINVHYKVMPKLKRLKTNNCIIIFYIFNLLRLYAVNFQNNFESIQRILVNYRVVVHPGLVGAVPVLNMVSVPVTR